MSEVLELPRESQGLAAFLATNDLAADWLGSDASATDRHESGQPSRWVWTWKN